MIQQQHQYSRTKRPVYQYRMLKLVGLCDETHSHAKRLHASATLRPHKTQTTRTPRSSDLCKHSPTLDGYLVQRTGVIPHDKRHWSQVKEGTKRNIFQLLQKFYSSSGESCCFFFFFFFFFLPGGWFALGFFFFFF